MPIEDGSGIYHALVIGQFASNAHVNPPDDRHASWYCLGDPTEGALISLAAKAGLNAAELEARHPELLEFPFDSARKRMSSIREYKGNLEVFVKGAPESLLARCSHIWDGKKVRRMTAEDRRKIQKLADDWADGALRNLVFASRRLTPGSQLRRLKMDEAETGLTFYSLVAMIDPPREEVPAAMSAAAAAHIPVSIITGDNALTARAVAEKAGLATKDSDITLVPGDKLLELSDHQIGHLITSGQVIFSRVAPEDKLRIVDIAKQLGRVVAVTGDGINDAPALKRADIGVAMGITGTDVAKDASEIVLLDDSFKTLVDAISYGRTIYQNIVKASLSCLTTNSAELFLVLASLLFGLWLNIPLALTAVQILTIDLIAELLPIAALGWDPPTGNIMHDKPRNLKSHILNRDSIVDLAWAGLLMGALAYGNFLIYFWRHHLDPRGASVAGISYMAATTLTYVTVCLCQFANILLRRVKSGKLFSRYLFSNKQLILAFLMSLSCMLLLIYLPAAQRYLGYSGLHPIDWLFAVAAATVFMIVRKHSTRVNP